MGRYRKLLVAVDGSESATNALKESFRLAADEKSWITVVSVVPPYEGDLSMMGIGNIMDSLRRPCREALAAADRLAQSERALIKTVCEEGPVYEKIIDLADAENCDLIITGRRGLKQLERTLVGSVTARIIGHSSRDVLVVPKGTRIGWRKIVLATDGSRYSSSATERAVDFARSYGGELKIVSVIDIPSEFYAEAPGAVEDLVRKAKGFVAEVRTRAESEGLSAETFIAEGEAFQVITDLVKQQEADVIVLGSHGRTGLRRLLMGSVTEKVIGYATCPVLIVKS